MKEKYHSINEVISALRKISMDFGINELASCVEESLIQSLVYINSLPTFAGIVDQGKFYVHGHCYLTGYLDFKQDGVAWFNNLIKGPRNVIASEIDKIWYIPIDQFVQAPQISGWNTDVDLFKTLDRNMLRLQSRIDHKSIQAFGVYKNELSVNNIRISNADLEKMKINIVQKLIEARFEIKDAINKKKRKRKSAIDNGRRSGQERKNKANSMLEKIKPDLLLIAEDIKPCSPNKLATIAAKKKIIAERQISNTAKIIRKDTSFQKYLKK